MGSFDIDKFIEALRKQLGKGEHENTIDEIEQAWQSGEKDALRKKSLELLENHRLRLSGSQCEVLKGLHKKIWKRKKGGIVENLKSRVKTIDEEKQTIAVQVQRFKEGLKERIEECDRLGKRVETLEEERQSVVVQLQRYKEGLIMRNDECDRLRKHVETLEEEKQAVVVQLQRYKEGLIMRNDECDRLRKQNRRLEDDLKEISLKLDKEREDRTAELAMFKTKLEQTNRAMEKKSAELERLKTSLGEMDEKNKELATRLSAEAGAKLLHNNPNILDLSDKDRPTKLSEKYSELYDNEWKNAFTALENSGWRSEEEIVKFLLELLADCFTECQIKAKEQLDQVKVVLLSPAGVMKQGTGNEKTRDEYTFTGIQENLIINLVKQTADVAYMSLFEVILVRHTYLPKKKAVKRYIRGCTELCWKMAVQTPPLYLDLYGWKDRKFQKHFFKEYTKVGPRIAFVVWPPLYLHEGGPLLCKGTAEGGK